MDRYTYTLNKERKNKEEFHYYSQEELSLMTTYQLRDICWKEQIINGIQAPLDKDELIRQILRFRGRKNNLFITQYSDKGNRRIEELLNSSVHHYFSKTIKGCAKIVTYEGLEMSCFDGFTIEYAPEIANTNALLVSGNEICAVFQLQQINGRTDCLFLTKSSSMVCKASSVKNYNLYCMERAQSEWMYGFYDSDYEIIPEHLNFYVIPIMDFQIRKLHEINMPLAIDFGTSNTTAGTYLDSGYLEKLEGEPIRESLLENEVNYVTYLDADDDAGLKKETPILPSVVGVTKIEGDKVHYVFGHQADRMFHTSYIDESFCVFYDIKRWISDTEREEELVDHDGHRIFVKRKDIIKVFMEYVIGCAQQRFKCNFKSLHISAPVKQKKLFIQLYRDILPQYDIVEEDMLDEGVAVLYNSISDMISEGRFQKNGQELNALIIDCGGGTTDLSSCKFSISNQRVSYKINIATAYENGDTDFGGNNLTYRIMELLKVALSRQLNDNQGMMPDEIINNFGEDIFRNVDKYGVNSVYEKLDEEYKAVEYILPTRFKDYEHRSNSEYYAVKNNFYYLFGLAEQIKKIFYGKTETLRIAVSSVPINEAAVTCLLADRFKLSVRENGQLHVIKDIPTVYFSVNMLNKLLKADIYGIIRLFIEDAYNSDELQKYSIMRLTGQSCKIELFREALKEFIPGKIIESSKREKGENSDYELKLMCLDGAIKYIKDKRFGYADIEIKNEHAVFPYYITAVTHTGEEKVLIHRLDRKNTHGYISRNMADLTLQLYLHDTSGNVRYKYNCMVNPNEFMSVEAEDIVEKYKGEIIQDDVDSIVNRELRFFVLADENRWGFVVIPVLRKEERLMLAQEQFFMFETDSWLTNFFDGTK